MRGTKQSTRPKVQVPTFRKTGQAQVEGNMGLNKFPLRQNVRFASPNVDIFKASGFGEMPGLGPQVKSLSTSARPILKHHTTRVGSIPMNLDMHNMDSEFFPPFRRPSLSERRPAPALDPSLSIKGSWAPEERLRSKRDTSRKLKSGPLTFDRSKLPGLVSKYKSEFEDQATRVRGVTFMSDHDRVRDELKKVGRNVQREIYDQIGKEFRRPDSKTQTQNDSDDDGHFDAKHRKELRNILKTIPKEDKSFTAIQKKIQEQREEWKQLKETVHHNRLTTGSFRSPSGPGGSGSGYGQYSKNLNTKPKLEAEDLAKDTQVVVNEKLAEISRQFRESLKLKSEPKNFIKTPKHSSANKLLFGGTKRPDDISLEGLDSLKLDENDSDEDEPASSLMNRPGAMFFPKGKSDSYLRNATPGTANTSTAIRRPKLSPALAPPSPLTFPVKSSAPSKRRDKVDTELDFAGVVKLRSLLEANSSELFANKVKQGAMDDHRRTVDPEYPHPPIERMIGPPKNLDPYMATRQVMKEKRDRELNFEINCGMTPISPGNIGPPPAPLKKTSEKISSQGQGQTRRQGQEQKPEITTEKIQKTIGESVKTMDEAAKVASSLGSLMTRVAASRVGNEDFQEQQQKLQTMFGQSASQPQRMTNFSNWNNSGKFSKREDIGTGTQMDSDNETQTAAEIQTQTETPSYYAFKPSFPDIKFKRDMSEVDQRRLEELRAKKREWDKEAAEMWKSKQAAAGQQS